MGADREHLLVRNLTAMAAGVAKAGQAGLALEWLLWSRKAGESLPRISSDSRSVKQFGDHHGAEPGPGITREATM